MLENLLRESQELLIRSLSTPKQLTKLAGAGLMLLGSLGAQAQTTTVFNETFEGTTNSFTAANGTQANQWFVGTAGGNGPTTAGTRAAFVSNDAGVTNAYTVSSLSVAHLYRDVTFPAGQNIIQVGFDWLAGGESTFDYIQVFVVPTTVTPVAGTQLVNGTAGAVQIGGNINLQSTFGRVYFQLPANLVGTTQRLVFTWRNDGSIGTQPPAVIDNVTVTAQTASPISGAFTINNALPTAGTNFTSFTDAANRLNLDGVSGATTISVLGGPYTEQFLLNQVAGTSATNRVVINGNGRTIQFASNNSNQRAVVALNGTDYLTLDSLNIDATNAGSPGTYGYGVVLTNVADHNVVRRCVVTSSESSTSSNFSGIVATGSVTSPTTSGNSANDLLLEGNTVIGGYYGITLMGTSTTVRGAGNILRNNTVRDFYYYGVYSYYQADPQFVGNDINRATRTSVGAFYGLYMYYNSNLRVERNRIHDGFTGAGSSASTAYPMYVYYSSGTAAAPALLANNLVYNINNSGSTTYGIYNYYSDYVNYYHNTVALNHTVAGTTLRAYYQYMSTGATLRNNIFSVTQPATTSAHAIYVYTTAAVATALSSNYNDLYAGTAATSYIGYIGTSSVATTASAATLAAWQAANSSAFDQNSVSLNPLFRSSSNLQPTNVGLNGTGTPTTLTLVPLDFARVTRNNPPDVGAYEFTPTPNDVELTSIDTPVSPATPGANPVTVTIRNGGTALLTSVTLSYALNGGTAVTQPFTGLNLAAGASQQLTFTTGVVAPSGTNTLVVTASLPNGTVDPTPGNNTATATFDQPTPDNDEPCSAIALSTTALIGSNSGASTSIQPGIVTPACSPSARPADVWFTATVAAGTNALNLVLTGAPTGMVRVFSSPSCSVGPFTPVFCRSSGANNTTVGTVTVPGLVAGQQYYIAVSGYGSADTGGQFSIRATSVLGSRASVIADALTIFPNPSATGLLTLEVRGGFATAAPLTVLNALGQVVYQSTVKASVETLNLSALAAGVYTVRVQTREGVLTQRVVRQ